MGFSKKIKDEILVLCARHCCVCNRYVGINIEIHHIKPQAEGGIDTLENAIALCFDCHANAGHYNPKHPKGLKYSQEELLLQKESWFKNVKENNIIPPKDNFVELIINNENFDGKFKPIFIREETIYIDWDSHKKTYEILGRDPMELVNEFKDNNKKGFFYSPFLHKVNTYDDFINFMNGDFPKKNLFLLDDVNSNTCCQPIKHLMPNFISSTKKEINLSNCILNLKLTNLGPEVLEDYKIYLTFENVVEVDSVNKNTEIYDLHRYSYNVKFKESNKAEFIPNMNVLVQNDSVAMDQICFRTKHDTTEVIIRWELFARNFQTNGFVKLDISPEIEVEENTRYVKHLQDKEETIRILPKIKFSR